ncbi:hypothetical protein BD626DRAFT_459000 [Schizophyllum amplum]|uniref:BTB domain-containing protein n=1 Tax=Schizophyllum amplum TaxID=97359 RepID=A0A550CB59_9AGAR|nr:hypothetical protein BD626DRAFT_459000 [Auriculariopsis ampla]
MNRSDTRERVAKRQRTDEGEVSVTAATRHGTHWYRDGSIVLHVDDVLFRVHQTTLERHSDFFKDLFGVPQPEGEEQVEGCPVVRLGGDKSVDWVPLLDAMYDTTLYFDALASQEFSEIFPCISGILRLATKYLIISYRRKCIVILSSHFPSGVTWQAKPAGVVQWGECCDMINLGRELNILMPLPYAFLRLATFVATRHGSAALDAVVPSLSPQDKVDLYRGALTLLAAQSDDMFPFIHTFAPSADCQAFLDCSLENALRSYRRQPYQIYFFTPESFGTIKGKVCDPCWTKVKDTFCEGRQKTWERLPEIFHLGKDWDELRRIQDNDGTPNS